MTMFRDDPEGDTLGQRIAWRIVMLILVGGPLAVIGLAILKG